MPGTVWSRAGRSPSINRMSDENTLMTITERVIPLFMNNTLTIRADRRDVYLSALEEVLPHARAEAGCLCCVIRSRCDARVMLPVLATAIR